MATIVFTQNPADRKVATGASTTFTVVASANAAITRYEWQIAQSSAPSTWVAITSADGFTGFATATLTLASGQAQAAASPTKPSNGDLVKCFAITNDSSNLASDPATLTVVEPSYAFTTPPTTIDEGATATVRVTVSPTDAILASNSLYWTIETNAGSFGTTSGSIALTGLNTGTFVIGPKKDNLADGAQTFTIGIRTGSVTGPIVLTSSAIALVDTSLSDTYTVHGGKANFLRKHLLGYI